jgi:hypothetical protein
VVQIHPRLPILLAPEAHGERADLYTVVKAGQADGGVRFPSGVPIYYDRDVAKLGIALPSGGRDRRFESGHPDHVRRFAMSAKESQCIGV